MPRIQLPSSFRPVVRSDLTLVGKNKDGGYWLSKSIVVRSSSVVGGGVATSWNFEKGLLLLNPNLDIVMCDGSVGIKHFIKKLILSPCLQNLKVLISFFASFYLNSNLKFKKKWISPRADSGSITIKDLVGRQDTILKIDIEGDEYPILSDILCVRDNLNAIVLEFHNAETHIEKISEFIESLIDFDITYLNANNYTGPGRSVPLAIEIVLERKQCPQANPQVANNPVWEPVTIDFVGP